MAYEPGKLIGVVEKNRVQDMRVRLVELRGETFVDLRVFAAADDGERRPTKKGMTFKPDLVPELIEVLAKAAADAPMALWQGDDTEKAGAVAQRYLETGSVEGPPGSGKGADEKARGEHTISDEEASAIFADIQAALGNKLAPTVSYGNIAGWCAAGASPTIIVAACRAKAADSGVETIDSLDFFNDAIARAVRTRATGGVLCAGDEVGP